MSRLVLLGLGDEDVDVLSRIARFSPRPEVLVFHPREESLILRLAALAEWPVTTRPPEPQPDDVAVVPAASPESVSEWIESWRSAGARILPPHALASEGDLAAVAGGSPTPAPSETAVPEPAEEPEPPPPPMEAPAAKAGEEAAADPAAGKGPASSGGPDETPAAAPSGTEPPAAEEPAFEPPRADDARTPPEAAGSQEPEPPEAPQEEAASGAGPPAGPEDAIDEPPGPAPIDEKVPAMEAHKDSAVSTPKSTPSPPADVWASPEGTFRYLVEQTLGGKGAVSLWWSGGTDVWVPWVWTGESVPHPQPDLDAGIRVSSAWGEFRVVGEGAEELNAAALQRIAEDMALRDLMSWRETARSLTSHGLPAGGADAAQLAAWLEPLWPVLGARAALFWRRSGEDWSLLGARGSGLTLSGVFHMPEDLLTATFEGRGTPWRRWDPATGLRLYLSMKSDDLRLPLRLRRLELVLSGEDGAR